MKNYFHIERKGLTHNFFSGGSIDFCIMEYRKMRFAKTPKRQNFHGMGKMGEPLVDMEAFPA